jgi:CxxC-x17-CxxC domain-containing protein
VGRYADKPMTCRDCGKQFTFTAGEQEFYASRGFSDPTFCLECRAADSEYSSYGSSPRLQGGARQMYPAVCAECGKPTEVAFEPRQGRPVYCRDCFQKHYPGW